MNYVLVFLGAGIGGAFREFVNAFSHRYLGNSFPTGTLIVNVFGSLAMGALAEYFALKVGASTQARLFLTTGILGGFTTFSTFSLDLVSLYERGDALGAALYGMASLVVSVGALVAAMTMIRMLMPAG
jgi:CrcB protein